VQRELLAALPVADAARAERIARHDFYTAARDAALIVHTADVRPYANLMLRKAGINRLEA
jgi:L-fucose mutarotase/ribose pyranase (RbsD/FucU family)